MTDTERKPYDPAVAIAAIEDDLVRTIANEIRDHGYRHMVSEAERIAAAVRSAGYIKDPSNKGARS
jgi:hypothetical protein